VKLLLDTHVFLWLQSDPDRIRADTRALLAAPANDLFLSAASVWEMAIKSRLGRLPLPEPLATYVVDRCRTSGVQLVAISAPAAFEIAELPEHHADPFDRMLVAQARTEGMRLVTNDRAIRRYDVDIVRA
jgi:PIN domain nuclease of toxin-antitoxin system